MRAARLIAHTHRILLLGCSGLLFSACAILPVPLQSGTWFRSPSEAMQARLLDVAYPLLTTAADWCPFDQEPTYGFLVRDQTGGAGAVVAYVHPALPAATAGLSVGDQIHSVNTVNVRRESAEAVGQLIGRLSRARIQPLQLDVFTGTEGRTVALSAVPACHYTLHVLPTDLINGVTDGRRIGVTRGAMQFVRSDDELAWIVAHELAHTILSHAQTEQLHAMVRRFLTARGVAADSMDPVPSKPSLEVQADSVGAYLMARAGYDLEAVRRVWEGLQRLEARQGGHRSRLAQTHPPTQERLAAFERTRQEIDAKRKAGQPLEIGLGAEQ